LTRVLCAGSFVLDIVAHGLPHIAAPGELVYAPDGIDAGVGGHAANVAIDLAQLGLRDVAAAGSVGDDPFGDFIEDELGRAGVGGRVERQAGAHTAKNIALVVDGEDRRFIAELTANTLLSIEHVVAALDDARPQAFYLGTIGGLRRIDERLDEVLEHARGIGCINVVDVVMPTALGWSRLTPAMPLIDVLHCNELEGAALTGEDDPLDAADALVDDGAGLAIVTLGPRGLVTAAGNLRLEMPAFDVDTVDPTGAGDAFCAGAIRALLEAGLDRDSLKSIPLDILKGVLLEGEAAGAACVTAPGATTAVTREWIERLIRAQGGAVLSGVRAA
jgi:sugar/nucleoside kinase (ribokinase family)